MRNRINNWLHRDDVMGILIFSILIFYFLIVVGGLLCILREPWYVSCPINVALWRTFFIRVK
jgi:hypothetical protein